LGVSNIKGAPTDHGVVSLVVVDWGSRGKKDHIRSLNKLIEASLGPFAHILIGENPPIPSFALL
jgi:hypothetical protein